MDQFAASVFTLDGTSVVDEIDVYLMARQVGRTLRSMSGFCEPPSSNGFRAGEELKIVIEDGRSGIFIIDAIHCGSHRPTRIEFYCSRKLARVILKAAPARNVLCPLVLMS